MFMCAQYMLQTRVLLTAVMLPRHSHCLSPSTAPATAQALKAAEDEETTACDTITSMTSHLEAKRKLHADTAAELEAKVAAITAPAVAERSELQQAHDQLEVGVNGIVMSVLIEHLQADRHDC